MSADLLAAFGIDSSESEVVHARQSAGEHLIEPHGTEANTWQPWPRPPEQKTKQPHEEALWREGGDTDVLFDADEDEDDFGDFERASTDLSRSLTTPVRSETLTKDFNLLDLDNSQIPGPDSSEQPKITRLKATKNRTLPSVDQEDDEWGDFEDTPDPKAKTLMSTKSAKPPAVPQVQLGKNLETQSLNASASNPVHKTSSETNDDWDDWDDQNPSTQQKNVSNPLSTPFEFQFSDDGTQKERPTNVPPPAVLLSLIPKVLSLLSSNTATTSSPEDIGLRVVEAYRVSARIIAGRALRWKRDTILAQSMRIGAAGRSGGMKLTALDKGESRKEDQEVEQALSAWSRHSLKLNAAIAKAKLQKPPLSLSATIPLRTATGADVLVANHPCPLCGLKRNERLNGIDISVSDTFGEFWIEHWGHKDCSAFWYQYMALLDQR